MTGTRFSCGLLWGKFDMDGLEPNSMTAGRETGLGISVIEAILSTDFVERSGAFAIGIVAESFFINTGIGAGAAGAGAAGLCFAETGGVGSGMEIFPIPVFWRSPTIVGRGIAFA